MKMIRNLRITPKLSLVFILFATLLLVSLSVPAYLNARASLRSAAISELLSTALEKEAALNAWVKNRQHSIQDIASHPHLHEILQEYTRLSTGSRAARLVHEDIVKDLQTWVAPGHLFLSLQIIEPENGRILISTVPGDEGKFREQETYFIQGLNGAGVENPFYDPSSGRNAMIAYAPIFASDGSLLAVLAGSLDLTEMNDIVERRTGLHQMDDAFLVNTSNLLVTQPRLLDNPSVLQRGIHTVAVNSCLNRASGVYEGADYRNMAAIVVYRWMVERNMCLIVKIDQQEAYSAARALNLTFILVGGLVLLAGSLASVAIARSLARPMQELLGGTIQLGQGDLEQRIQVRSTDEIGALGQAFNHMADSLMMQDAQLRSWGAELENKVEQRTLELRESEERYRILAETSPDMIFVIDREDRVRYVNNLAARQFGKTPEMVMGKERDQLFPPAIAERQGQALQQVFSSGEPLSSESPHIFPGGQRWLDTHLVPLRDKTGQVHAVMGVSRDVTQRKNAEMIIREEKAFSDSIINILPGIFYLFDAQGKFLLWNRNFEKISGYSSDEMMERNPLDFFAGDEKALVQERIQKAFMTGQADVEANFTSRDGVGRPYYLTGVRIQVKDQPHLIGVGLDITERKLAEDKLRQINARFVLATTAAAMGIWELDLTNDQLIWDDQIYKLFGVKKEDFSGASEAWLKGIHPEDRVRINEELQEALLGEKEFDTELRTTWPDGTIHNIKSYANILRDPSGKPLGMVGVNYDITDRKLAEEKLLKLMADLSRSNAELERFAYVASHDLQEPLRMVTSYLQLLERRYKDKLDEDAREFINYAVDGSSRMKTLIGDLLAYSRVGTRGKEFEWVDCEKVLKNVLKNLEVSITESQASLTHDRLPKVMGDDTQLESLFQNLISNALKFHGDRKPEIHIGFKKEANFWVFAVRDNGIGIDPQYFERIFIIFQRLHNRQEYTGTGIGLAISKRIVERHGGRIWIESQPGQGSTFFFTLPMNRGSSHD